MDLKEIREKINAIDNEMKELFDKRLACSEQVARVKIETGDSVYKPLRERDVVLRFAKEDPWYPFYVRKIMQISRRYQYGVFLQEAQVDAEYLEGFGALVEDVLAHGGTLNLSMVEDESSEKGLSKYEILSLLGDTKLPISHMCIEGGKLAFTLCISGREPEEIVAQVRELCYMLYRETKMFDIK